MDNEQQNQFPFFNHYQNVIRISVSEGIDLLEKASNCMAPWYILVSYLFEQEKVNAERVQPLLEVIGGSPVSVYLAASGAYREAIAVLRPLLEMVLIEWYCVSIVKDNPNRREAFQVLYAESGFSPQKGVPSLRHDQLFNLEEVKTYRHFIQSRANEETANYLLQYVDDNKVLQLRDILGNYVHAHPAIYNIVQGEIAPFQPFNRQQLEWWLDLFRQVHEAIVLWVQFIYPMIMTWSKTTLVNQVPWLKLNETQRMEIYWTDMLHPIQLDYFAKGLSLGS